MLVAYMLPPLVASCTTSPQQCADAADAPRALPLSPTPALLLPPLLLFPPLLLLPPLLILPPLRSFRLYSSYRHFCSYRRYCS